MTVLNRGTAGLTLNVPSESGTEYPFTRYGWSGITAFTLGTGDHVVFAKRSNNWNYVSGNAELGVGQTWQDVSTDRVAGTYYENLTGRPIMAIVGGVFSPSNTASIYIKTTVGGTPISIGTAFNPSAISSFRIGPITFVVPPGHFYALISAVAPSQLDWSELR
ncbi:MAG: hypothetical protein JZU60_02670 [Ilumatobacteraceae bacterium]|nr:hypothetical protein [Ilumatobacteraceae bacterium]